MKYKPFKKIVLFGKRRYEKSTHETLVKLKKYLEKNHRTVYLEQGTAELFKIHHGETLQEDSIKEQAELIIVVGGDGSLLNAAKTAVKSNLPILGINRGKLGFLTDISPDNFTSLEHILQGNYKIEKRFLLKAEIFRGKKILHRLIALNDFVLLPGKAAHMVEFFLDIDKEFMCAQKADGLIIATPTGSTAYALSGGGPILHPQLDAMVLVPMFPHKLTSRPVVISGKSQIHLTLSLRNETIPRLSCDGQIPISLESDDKVTIQKYTKSLNLIHPVSYQYFSTLRSKLYWENKPY